MVNAPNKSIVINSCSESSRYSQPIPPTILRVKWMKRGMSRDWKMVPTESVLMTGSGIYPALKFCLQTIATPPFTKTIK